MKKLLLIPLVCLLGMTSWAQDTPLPVTASQTVQSQGYTIQVGLPFLGQNFNEPERTTNPIDIRFPWDILYVPNTFSDVTFDVSKGYFGDQILVSWLVGANQNLVTNIRVFRREYTEDGTGNFLQIANTAPTATTYEDEFVEGGILYEYKIMADGVSNIDRRGLNFIDGIGYRSPTAIVTGSVNFEGGNPVQDVIIRARSQGNEENTGSALNIPSNNTLILAQTSKQITTAGTLQAYLKPETAFANGDAPVRLFEMISEDQSTRIATEVDILNNATLRVTIGGAEYRVENYFPSGNLDSSGNDLVIPVSEFNTSFVHFSVVITDNEVPLLYINGRLMSEEYPDTIATYDPELNPEFSISEPTSTITLSLGGVETRWNNFNIGGQKNSLVDEIRLWRSARDAQSIRLDYRRFISGNNSSLISYLRANEGVGQFAYDLSRSGFNYNNNHGRLYNLQDDADRLNWISGDTNIPTEDQLGVLGVTDINGNYEITAIPYSGTGESFTITPLLGVHEFDPNQQLVFLGQGSEVVNSINFTDVSSFSFKGRVLYDSRGVFPSFVDVNTPPGAEEPNFNNLTDGDEFVSQPGIIDEGYNFYTKGQLNYQKGEYWYNDNNTPGDTSDDYLERYARIASPNVNIFIDGQIVLDENNIPVVSNGEGFFDVSVPIGNHFITLGKMGHEFEFDSRFPALSGSTQEFFEDRNDVITFIDNTKVTLVGRVVGGSVESQKVIGFGGDGLAEESYVDSNGISQNEVISSVNNIGVASLTLGYMPLGSPVTPFTRFSFSTNEESGEYRVEALPLSYEINQTSGLTITTNNQISLLDSNETVNLVEIVAEDISEYTLGNGITLTSAPYQYERSFIFRSTPTLRVVSQTSDTEITIGENTFSTEGFEFPIYTQFQNYFIRMQRFERYVNFDTSEEIEDIVPVIDGELVTTNNLALEGTEVIEVNSADPSILDYSFRGGIPRITAPFTKSINLLYQIDGAGSFTVENYAEVGILVGGAPDGSQTFTTAAPDIPDIILRDPPGSNSFATIASGESITLTANSSIAGGQGIDESVTLSIGGEISIGGGLTGPIVTVDNTQSATIGLGVSKTSDEGKELSKTYTFSQTISTSSDPNFVGADGDLYIGQSKNYAYGAYDEVFSSETLPNNTNFIELTNADGETVVLALQKSMYFLEEPSDTFFIFSQRQILDNVIPDLQEIIDNYDPNTPGIQSLDYYIQQIRLWRNTILENERSKYVAINNREEARTQALSNIDIFINQLNTAINEAIDTPTGTDLDDLVQDIYEPKLQDAQSLRNLINNNFSDNISFDAGVGELSRTIETSVATSLSNSYEVDVDETFALDFNFSISKVGINTVTSGAFSQNISASSTIDQESTTEIAYTLQDNDNDNFLSLDVVNLFDGNGPVFSTIGGQTSCPYEGAEKTIFYNPTTYNPGSTDAIEPLDEALRLPLNTATQRIENPGLSVEIASVTNVPESQNAEYELILDNNSVTGTDATFLLIVDNTTNPNNAVINIEQNGTMVNVPFGQQVTYSLTLAKSISDVNDYNDIRIILQSLCDPDGTFDDVLISAQFVPACSAVVVNAPLDNWAYNRDAGINLDGSTNPLQIGLNGFDLSFNSFRKIDLEYRLSTSPTWTRLQTYYTTQAFFNDAQASGETEISLIESPNLSFPFDIAELGLQDGNYDIRARTSCVNGTTFTSSMVSGTVDLTAPRRFNTPSPIDGILSTGEDLKVSFNEDIFFNSAVSLVEIKGRTNQLLIDNNVSVLYTGVNTTSVIQQPNITTGNFSMEFWMNNQTLASNATIVSQNQGLEIRLEGNTLFFKLGDNTISAGIFNDDLFHHYTFTYNNEIGLMRMYQDDTVLDELGGLTNPQFTNDNDLVLGGNTFVGNIHDVRLWEKYLTLDEAFANLRTDYIGNERDLVGYWPMNEGRGNVARDLARFNNMVVNTGWDIKPKGESYRFENGQYQNLDNVGFVQLTDEMDATLSFWVKTDTAQEGTIFSNGLGDGNDLTQANGLMNKWAVNMTASGAITLDSEGTTYDLTTTSLADDSWHHVAMLLNRNGSLRTYLDGQQVSSNSSAFIGGFSGGNVFIGARGFTDTAGNITIDNEFTGNIDEVRLWNTLRNIEQITRDQYNEVDFETTGLLLYARMNAPDPETGNGPRYFHAFSNNTVISSLAQLNTGTVNYSNDTPPIKPEREIISFQVNRVINGDEMILIPVVTDFASIEGQVLDITVHRMFDAANNIQQSPITWTAFIDLNDVDWFANGFNNNVVDIVKEVAETSAFDITLKNRGGTVQPYNVANVPSWLTLSSTNGSLQPNTSINLTATIDNSLSPGDYDEDIFLQTDFGLDQKIQINLKVLTEEPDWDVNPADFEFSMNVVGRIQIDGIFSADEFDMIGAFENSDVRGSAHLTLDVNRQEYFVFLTLYSNEAFGEEISFRIWDASQGRVLLSTINGLENIAFENNGVIGSFSNPAIFENNGDVVQDIAFNQGFTWISFNVNDNDFDDINALTSGMTLETSDRILSHAPSLLDAYYVDISNPVNNGWSGTLSNSVAGITSDKMYKVSLANSQSLMVEGSPVDAGAFSFDIQENWNWLPYPFPGNNSVNESLALFDAVDGDVIKSQGAFAIYDDLNGWSGTLTSLRAGRGYMIKASNAQDFSYPNYLVNSLNPNDDTDEVAQRVTNYTMFAETMNAVVRLPEGYDTLYGYDAEGHVKGESITQNVFGELLSFITIFGNDLEGLRFHVGNTNQLKSTSTAFNFSGNDVMGTIDNPVVLEVFENSIRVYPNPFENDLTLDVNVSKAQTIQVELFSITNQRIMSKTVDVSKGQNTYVLSSELQSGVYFIKMTMDDQTITEKIIKK